jgi:hypothetical protein
MGQEKMHFDEWIDRIGRLIEELESEPRPRRPLTSLTARQGLQNWLVYRAISVESPAAPPRISILHKSGHRGMHKRNSN